MAKLTFAIINRVLLNKLRFARGGEYLKAKSRKDISYSLYLCIYLLKPTPKPKAPTKPAIPSLKKIQASLFYGVTNPIQDKRVRRIFLKALLQELESE